MNETRSVTKPPGELPVVFISHRHDDRELASRLTATLGNLFADRVEVFNTSGRETRGVEPGAALRPEIERALSDAQLVILLYTDHDADWSWCFFECGVAINDDTDTKIVVVDFAEKDPPLFHSERRIVVNDPAIEGASGADDLVRFLEFLCGDQSPIPEAQSLVDPELSRTQIRTEGENLYRDLWRIGPAAQARLTEQLLRSFSSVPLNDRDRFSDLLEGASRALAWGLGEAEAVRDLFVDYWDQRLLSELTNLADRKLVFRPGRVSRDWGRLLEIAGDRFAGNADAVRSLNRPVLALVSREEGDPFEFWEEAQSQAASDAYAYEEHVRALARRLHDSFQGVDDVDGPFVRRVLVLQEGYCDSVERAERLSTIVSISAQANIDMSVSFLTDIIEDEWRDYGIVGDLAVSKFTSLRNTFYRSLSEDFSPQRLEIAHNRWHALPTRWSTSMGSDPETITRLLG